MLRASAQTTITYVKDGQDGKDGTPGTPGADARIYFIEPSVQSIKRSIKITQDESGESVSSEVLMPASVTFKSYYRTGTATTRTAYSGRYIIAESTDGSTFVNKYTSSANESSKTYSPSMTAVLVRCTLYAAGGTTVAIDLVTLPIISDVDSIKEILDDVSLDTNTKIEQLKQYIDQVSTSSSAEISKTQDSISMQATQIETAQNDVLIIQEQLESLLNLTAGSLQISIGEMETIVADINGEITELLKSLRMYFDFGSDGLTIRKNEDGTESPFNLFINNKTIQFRSNNTIVAYISNNQLFIPDAVVERLAIGSENGGYYLWIVESDRSLTLKRRQHI